MQTLYYPFFVAVPFPVTSPVVLSFFPHGNGIPKSCFLILIQQDANPVSIESLSGWKICQIVNGMVHFSLGIHEDLSKQKVIRVSLDYATKEDKDVTKIAEGKAVIDIGNSAGRKEECFFTLVTPQKINM